MAFINYFCRAIFFLKAIRNFRENESYLWEGNQCEMAIYWIPDEWIMWLSVSWYHFEILSHHLTFKILIYYALQH